MARTPGAVDVLRAPLSGQTYLEVHMDHAAMARFGVSSEDLNELIETAVGGQVVTSIVEESRTTDVLLRYPAEQRDSQEALGHLMVDTPTGAKVPLENLAEISLVDGPVQLEHENGLRFVVIESNVEGRDIVGLVQELRASIAREVPMPPGYFVEFGGQFENQQRAAARLALVVPLALALVFLILFSTFRSLRQALLILLNIPFALIGGVGALYLSGLYLSVPASVGFIALLGTALLNGIVMVSYFNQLRESGVDIDTAVRQGASRRLRPVLMTAVTTALGLVPPAPRHGPRLRGASPPRGGGRRRPGLVDLDHPGPAPRPLLLDRGRQALDELQPHACRMKCLTLFVHASLEHELVDRLRGDERVSGFTLTPCQGHSTSTEDDPFLATRDRVIGHVPRLRIEIVLEDEIVTSVLEGLRECGPPGASLGAWHVTDVLDFGRL